MGGTHDGALGVPARAVTLVSGATSRTKLVEVPDAAAVRLAELRGEGRA